MRKILKQLIKERFLDADLTHTLISKLYDTDGKMTERVYNKLIE